MWVESGPSLHAESVRTLNSKPQVSSLARCCAAVYIFSKTIEQHLSRLRDLLSRSVHYLGYIVSGNGVEVDQEKTKCVAFPIKLGRVTAVFRDDLLLS